MHLADGVLSHAPLLIGLNVTGACAVASAVRRSFDAAGRQVAWTGTLAAFVLVAQALNVPAVPGASAHVIGAGLLTLAVGPARAVVALFAVLVVQALLLGDGGVTVLGINALNLAVLPALCTHALRRIFGESRAGLGLAALLGVLLGNVVGACSLAAALVVGAAAPPAITFGWLVGVQGVAGVVEGLLTALAVQRLLGRAPALLRSGSRASAAAVPLSLDDRSEPARASGASRGLRWAAVAIVLAAALLPFASTRPDALELVLEHLRASR
jgi:cobalt/nickel transport system permease protein